MAAAPYQDLVKENSRDAYELIDYMSKVQKRGLDFSS